MFLSFLFEVWLIWLSTKVKKINEYPKMDINLCVRNVLQKKHFGVMWKNINEALYSCLIKRSSAGHVWKRLIRFWQGGMGNTGERIRCTVMYYVSEGIHVHPHSGRYGIKLKKTVCRGEGFRIFGRWPQCIESWISAAYRSPMCGWMDECNLR